MAKSLVEQQIWNWLAEVPDPEIPVLSVTDLGIVRKINIANNAVEVEVSPTYSGCPATEVIEDCIIDRLKSAGVDNVTVKRVLSPPWTTDWISQSGREKMLAYGIAPPAGGTGKRELIGKTVVRCPRCGTAETSLVSEFGSTACKASYKCSQCLEPFEYFKCL